MTQKTADRSVDSWTKRPPSQPKRKRRPTNHDCNHCWLLLPLFWPPWSFHTNRNTAVDWIEIQDAAGKAVTGEVFV